MSKPFTPTEPGYYWAIARYDEKTPENLKVVEVYRCTGEELNVESAYGGNHMFDGWLFYAGPMTPPDIAEGPTE